MGTKRIPMMKRKTKAKVAAPRGVEPKPLGAPAHLGAKTLKPKKVKS